MSKDNGKEKDQKCCEEALSTVEKYRDVMVECFKAALKVMELGGVADRVIQTKIALALFNSATREVEAHTDMFTMATDFMTTLIEEKEADDERLEELRSVAFPGRPTVFFEVCDHPGLRALYEQSALAAKILGKNAEASTDKIIQAMAIGKDDQGGGFLVCSHCRLHIPVVEYRSGELWNEEAEASRKAAAESEEGEEK